MTRIRLSAIRRPPSAICYRLSAIGRLLSPISYRLSAIGYLLSLFVGCSILSPDPTIVIRPGCRIRVLDDATGVPIDSLKLTIITLYNGSDTAGRWTYTTDNNGVVEILSERARRSREILAGRGRGHYVFVAACEDSPDFRYFSQRIFGGSQTIRLNRGYMLAAE